MAHAPTDASASHNLVRPADDLPLVRLIQQMGGGDTHSLARLYDLTGRSLYSVAHSVLRSAMDSEEIICDTFLYVWKHAHDYDSTRGSVMAWLTVVTRYRALDLLRKCRKRFSLQDDEARFQVANIPCGADGPEQVVARAQARRIVHNALAELPPSRRTLLELAFFDQLTHQEISRALGMPAGTVKSHIRRTLRKLEAAIVPTGIAAQSLKVHQRRRRRLDGDVVSVSHRLCVRALRSARTVASVTT